MKLSLFSFLLVFVLMFSSCEKGKFYKDKDYKEFDKENLEDKKECFELTYPLTYLMPDGYVVSGDDEKALWMDIKTWYNNNPAVEEKPVLQYPVDVRFKNDSVTTIQNEAEMIEAKKDCD